MKENEVLSDSLYIDTRDRGEFFEHLKKLGAMTEVIPFTGTTKSTGRKPGEALFLRVPEEQRSAEVLEYLIKAGNPDDQEVYPVNQPVDRSSMFFMDIDGKLIGVSCVTLGDYHAFGGLAGECVSLPLETLPDVLANIAERLGIVFKGVVRTASNMAKCFGFRSIKFSPIPLESCFKWFEEAAADAEFVSGHIEQDHSSAIYKVPGTRHNACLCVKTSDIGQASFNVRLLFKIGSQYISLDSSQEGQRARIRHIEGKAVSMTEKVAKLQKDVNLLRNKATAFDDRVDYLDSLIVKKTKWLPMLDEAFTVSQAKEKLGTIAWKGKKSIPGFFQELEAHFGSKSVKEMPLSDLLFEAIELLGTFLDVNKKEYHPNPEFLERALYDMFFVGLEKFAKR